MAVADPERAIVAISAFRNDAQQADMWHADWYKSLSVSPPGQHPYDALSSQMHTRLPLIEAIAREVDAAVATQLRSDLRAGHNGSLVDACDLLLGTLNHQQEIEAIIGPSGPRLAASQMHPWVWANAASLWGDGHHRQAVQTAASAIFDSQLPAKLRMPYGTKPEQLVGQAFDEKGPLLKLEGIVPGNDWANAYQGAMHLGLSCAKLVRNLGTHHVTAPGDEDVLLEELAMLSRFARLVDAADLAEAPSLPQ